MTTPLLNNPCTGCHEIYNFSRPYIGHPNYINSLGDLCLGVEQNTFNRKGCAVATKCLFSNFIDQYKEWQRKLIINFTDFDNERKSEQAHIPHALSLLQNAAHYAYNHYQFGQISKFKKGVIPR